MRPTAGIDDFAKSWIADQLERPISIYAKASVIPIVHLDKIIACAAFTNFEEAPFGNIVQAHLAVLPEYHKKIWCRKDTLGLFAAYPFIELGCTRVWVQTAKNNYPARNLALKLGFKFEGSARRGWDGKHPAMIYSMLYDECKYLKYYIEIIDERAA